jgi:hypothetical protein
MEKSPLSLIAHIERDSFCSLKPRIVIDTRVQQKRCPGSAVVLGTSIASHDSYPR